MSKTMNAVAILLCARAAHAEVHVLFFLDEAEFQAALEQTGKIKEGFEVFPWLAGPGSIISIGDPLNTNTSVPGWIEPGVLLDNVQYQSNLDPFGPNGPNPRGSTGMRLFTTGFIGATSNGTVAGHFVDSFDILSGVPEPANHTAMGLQLISFNHPPPGPSVTVSVYDKDENLIGTESGISAPANLGGAFLGILATGGNTIGRVNLYDTNHQSFDAEGLYSIAVYVSGPCLWDLNDDGSVGVPDLLILLAFWGPCPPVCLGDFDGDHDVGVSDLLMMLANWGPCP